MFETCRRNKEFKEKINIILEKVRFVCLYCVIILECKVQKHKINTSWKRHNRTDLTSDGALDVIK
jgi:hypothetical protein